MIGFDLTEEQRMIRDLARDFAQNEIAPQAAHHDETGEFPHAICKKAFELGLLNPGLPEKYGGAGMSCLMECVIAEELAAAEVRFGRVFEAGGKPQRALDIYNRVVLLVPDSPAATAALRGIQRIQLTAQG